MASAAQRPADRLRRQPRLAARPDDRAATSAATGAIERKPTKSSYQRPGHLGHGPAVERRHDGGRGAEHARGLPGACGADRTRALHLMLESSRFSFADRNAYLADPDFFDVPVHRAAVGLVRGRAPRSDRRESRGGQPGGGGQPLRQSGRPRQRPPHECHDQPPVPVHDPPHGRRIARARSSPTPSRSSPPAATASSSRATGFLLNNELTDFNYDSDHPPQPGGR